MSDESKAKISAAKKGRRLTPEHRAKISAALRKQEWCAIPGCDRRCSARGWCHTHYMRWRVHGDPLVLARPRGSDHHNWKGEDATYGAIHRRLACLPRRCAACGATTGRLEVALLKTAPLKNMRMSEHGPYSVVLDDYVRLCVRCHRRYDSPRADTRQEIADLLDTTQPQL